MESDLPSPNEENNEQKAEFRKLTNDAAHRSYRRRSPVAGVSDKNDGSPKRDHSSRRDSKVVDYDKRNGDRVDDRFSNRSQDGRRSDSHSSRGDRHDEHPRYGKHADVDGRSHAKSSHRTGRDHDRDYNRSRDRYKDVDRYSRDRSDFAVKKYKDKESPSDRTGHDGRHGSRYDRDRYPRDRDHRDDQREYKNSRDHKSNRTTSFEDSGRERSDVKSKWDIDDVKDVDKHEDRLGIGGKKAEHGFPNEDIAVKRPKLFTSEDTKVKKVDETSNSKLMPNQATVNGSDSDVNADAAKVAALKAAELVNKNLTGMGIMTADQKKKLLWGSKKSTATEEPAHRWDSAIFSDRERQEKFNKLMGVKGEVKVASKPVSSQDAEKLEVDLEKQYTAGLRRRDGRTVGLGL